MLAFITWEGGNLTGILVRVSILKRPGLLYQELLPAPLVSSQSAMKQSFLSSKTFPSLFSSYSFNQTIIFADGCLLEDLWGRQVNRNILKGLSKSRYFGLEELSCADSLLGQCSTDLWVGVSKPHLSSHRGDHCTDLIVLHKLSPTVSLPDKSIANLCLFSIF